MWVIEAFNITLVGANFPVENVDLDDFDFGETKPKVQLRLQQALLATAGDLAIQILPDRFQIISSGTPPDSSRIAILKKATHDFMELYASKRSIIAIGHNFAGSFPSATGSADDFMKRIAWHSDFIHAIQLPPDPTLAVIVSTKIDAEQKLTMRLEPKVTDKSRIFFDLNFNWGELEKPLPMPASDAIERYNDSLDYAEGLIDRLEKFGASSEGSRE